jgi:hypothetical protein
MSQQSCQSCIIITDPALYKGRFTERNRETIFPNFHKYTVLWMRESQTKCIWADGFRDDLGNVRAAVSWKAVDEWMGLKYRLRKNKEVFDSELFGILQATMMIRDEAAVMIIEGIQKALIFTDSQAALD